MVNVTLYVDGDGRICEIKTDISIVPTENSKIETWIIMNGLYDDDFLNFVNTDWESLGEDWIADEEYDCFL